ncbi:LTA synthase family protein [Clostridium felsineum]|uniref:Lipoteichoic acid synthase 1 n=1 Tax=Clostridium felsineum TaxID=36839 RepID=A0A1S8MGF9_9CLOT|nr:LTA synthase family protein [Clostridium felsineum]URZ07863.1 Lipoteichoic acid synthase 1 [Clostridium felsineum]URZ12894.1 Lipoteichoic acid synthase 1 [Clostridium felsineum]
MDINNAEKRTLRDRVFDNFKEMVSRENIFEGLKNAAFYLWKSKLMYYTVIILFVKSLLVISNISYTNPTFQEMLTSYTKISHAYIYIYFIVLIISFAYLFKNRGHMWFLIGANLLLSILFVIDVWYYRGFTSLPTLYSLNETGNLDNLSSTVFSLMRKTDILFIIDLFILVPYGFINKKIYKKHSRNIVLFLALFIISSIYTIYVPYKVNTLNKYDVEQTFFEMKWKPSITICNASPIGYHYLDIYNYIKNSRGLKLTSDDKKEIKAWFDNKNKENLPDNQYSGMFKGKNLLVIQVESLENFVINKNVNGQEITPTLNKLLKNSLYFSNYNEEVNQGTTSDAELMTNTSIYPVSTGSTFFRYPNNKYYNSLPNILGRQGYFTQALHADKGSFWNWKPALSSIGFQNIVDSTGFKDDENIGLGLSDGSFLNQATPMVEKSKGPWYNYVITMSGHAPFDLPAKYRELKLNSELDSSYLGGYLQSVHYEDKQIGIFLDNLKKNGTLDNTMVVIYGDHCGIHKYYQSDVETTKGAESWMIDNHKEVPLIIYNSSLTGKEIKTTGGQVDLMPTILYLLGIDKKEYINTAMGRNLLNTNESYAVWSNGEFVGNAKSKSDKDKAVKGLDIANKIIESDYFKSKPN